MNLQEFISGLDYTIIIYAVAAILAITFHEFCHGLAAYALGDSTAKDMGRLTLNPLKHIDVIGAICLVVFKFGWAKPVPVDMRRFRKPKAGMAISALAGPVANILFAFVALVLAAVARLYYDTDIGYWAYIFFYYLAVINVCLGIFNIIPIPPLDGSKILLAILPHKAYLKLMRYERFGMIILIILLATGILSPYFTTAYTWVLNALWSVASFPLKIYLGM